MQLKTEVFKTLRKVFGEDREARYFLKIDCNGQDANDLIRNHLQSNAPCLVGRFGSNELDATLRAFELSQPRAYFYRVVRYIRGEGAKFWWDSSIRKRMNQVAGLFPATDDSLERFGQRILEDCQEIDVLGSWRQDEWRLRPLFPNAKTIDLIDLEPFRHVNPWSVALRGKKVLVIHPFEESIQQQYAKRKLLFHDPDVLPDFELKTLKAVQSNGTNDVGFHDWFQALEHMCSQIEQIDFDVAIIGAGAYGLPIAAHVKRMGRQAVHLGGATQLLFGIRGQRWEDGAYDYVYNEHWVRPMESEKPNRSDLVERNAYW